jgi:transcriptional regulator with XRE-family HTH domain
MRQSVLRPDTLRAQEFNRFADTHAVESLRLAVRRELRVHRGQRALARLIGVSRGTLRKFVEMRSLPTPNNLEKIRDWTADRPEVQAPLGSVALAVIAEDLPADFRFRARMRLTRELASVYAEAGEAPPAWVAEELGL